jgi:hypothetical protein
MEESGMGKGVRADALGDGDDISDSAFLQANLTPPVPTNQGQEEEPILPEALKGDMTVEKGTDEKHNSAVEAGSWGGRRLSEEEVDKMKEAERKGFGEVY